MSTIKERFFAKITKGPNCWEWNGFKRLGYGVIFETVGPLKRQRKILAHRYSYEIHKGLFDKKSCVLHRCDNRACVNPEHLFLGTRGDNNKDRSEKGRSANGNHLPFSKVNPEIVRQIRAEYKPGVRGFGQRALSKKFGIHQDTIRQIALGITWRHVK